MEVRGRATANVLAVKVIPERIVQAATTRSCEEFVTGVGSSKVLLVQIDDVEAELAQVLLDASAAATEPLRSGDGLAFGTTVGSPTAPTSRRYGVPLDVTRLQTVLVKSLHFVAPLVKRIVAGKPFSERISVGRARNNDIVLRHRSVSKFHAWFELGDGEELRLGDARSTNRTLLNGRVVAKELPPIVAGDEVVFGAVHATVCPTSLLWEALAS